jgi:hypothetical protein
MKSPKKLWFIALCILAALVTAMDIGALRSSVRASWQRYKIDSKSSGHLVNASLRAEMLPIPTLFGGDVVSPQYHVSTTVSSTTDPHLPTVEEFILTPPNPAIGIYKTNLSVRFPELAAERMASQVPMTVGDQTVTLRRSADDSAVFSTTVDFDWNAFAKEQQQRKDLASTGKVIPVFEGRRLVRMDTIEFVDPASIQNAQQSHQPVQFTPEVLEGTGFTIHPEKELMITDLSVVTDPNRTWDSCTNGSTGQMGAWTFGQLMTAMTGTSGSQLKADAMVQAWLNQWLTAQTINTFVVAARTNMSSLILSSWPKDSNGNVAVSQAPFQLNAIVNRIDLGQGSTPTGGEVRFVFGVCTTGTPFNVIIEYGVPASVASGCAGVQGWANQWHNLSTVGTSNYNAALQAITDQVATAGADTTKPFGSALNQVRTNDERLGGLKWELRQFQLTENVATQTAVLRETTIAQTPDSENSSGDFNGAQGQANAFVLTDYINEFQSQIISGNYTVPLSYNDPNSSFNGPFLGASVFNAPQGFFPGYWNGTPTPTSTVARADFSLNTCNGCHSRETATNDVFQQVQNRQPGSASALSGFLLGCNNSGVPLVNSCISTDLYPLATPGQENVQDPVTGGTNTFGDLVRRQAYMSSVLGENCKAEQMLQSLVRHKEGFVH